MVPGLNDGEVDLSWTSTGDDPGNVGKPKRYEIRYSSTPINDLVDWDYATPVGGVFPAPVLGGVVQNVTATGLTPGATYFFAVRSFDNAWYDVLSNTVASDVMYGGIYRPAGIYEDNHSGWEYSSMIPTWIPVSNISTTAGHYRRISNAPAGSFARFWFKGTSFQLLFLKGVGYGKLAVYVDGVYVTTINQYYPVTLYKRAYRLPAIAFGDHVVEFRVVGTRANIDRIWIFP